MCIALIAHISNEGLDPLHRTDGRLLDPAHHVRIQRLRHSRIARMKPGMSLNSRRLIAVEEDGKGHLTHPEEFDV